ncbi:hypothetical protein SLD79_002935 [Listeria monocytogenes]|nr:hypothetical protein [Listeria monocytogenes]EAF1191521.1 hypothetical protein [Listeria monocytogenes]EAF8993834.1 hypothetical protein [Listeria monocytogenes]EGK1805762.1 hypothetical protein [Listeria monocytogenes]ELX8695793.1 hypothetical protein [Listeria monocytogenes]
MRKVSSTVFISNLKTNEFIKKTSKVLDNNNIYNKSSSFASMKNNASKKSELNDTKQEFKSIEEKKKDKKESKALLSAHINQASKCSLFPEMNLKEQLIYLQNELNEDLAQIHSMKNSITRQLSIAQLLHQILQQRITELCTTKQELKMQFNCLSKEQIEQNQELSTRLKKVRYELKETMYASNQLEKLNTQVIEIDLHINQLMRKKEVKQSEIIHLKTEVRKSNDLLVNLELRNDELIKKW